MMVLSMLVMMLLVIVITHHQGCHPVDLAWSKLVIARDQCVFDRFAVMMGSDSHYYPATTAQWESARPNLDLPNIEAGS